MIDFNEHSSDIKMSALDKSEQRSYLYDLIRKLFRELKELDSRNDMASNEILAEIKNIKKTQAEIIDKLNSSLTLLDRLRSSIFNSKLTMINLHRASQYVGNNVEQAINSLQIVETGVDNIKETSNTSKSIINEIDKKIEGIAKLIDEEKENK